MGVKLAAALGGSVELVPTNTASNYTATMPAKTGNVMIDGPAFSAYVNGNQTISNLTFTKAQFNAEVFDTNSNFNNTGSTVGGVPAYAFLPTVAGYYLVTFSTSLYGGSSTTAVGLSQLYKNGASYKGASTTTGASGFYPYSVGTSLVYMNGTTDYLDVYVYYSYGSGTPTIAGDGASRSEFSAVLVRGA